MNGTPDMRFSKILNAARALNASDIHIIADLPPALRIGGEIVMASADVLTREDLLIMAKTILEPAQHERFERERELCVSHHHPACGRIRLSLYHRLGIPEMAIRMCATEVRSADELGLPAVVETLINRSSGLVLITGPTGVGKTTTLNYMIDFINTSRKSKIITIEDPVEYEHAHRRSIVVQLEVTTDTLGFASCLRHVLRLDPDVICVGEMRDLDTIATALTAAETGHLVIATLHTPSATGAIERIVNAFEGARQHQVMMQLSEILQGVVAQRLVPVFDKSDRVLACETLIATGAVRNIIREGNFHQLANAMVMARADGMQTMEESLAGLYREGLITLSAAMANAARPEALEQLLER